MSALAGRSVLITRPREQAETLAAALRAHGAVPVLFPTIEVRPADAGPIDRAIAELDRYTWIVFTSANAVRFFGDRLTAADVVVPGSVRIAAVGAATASALAARDIGVHAVPDEFLGARIADALEPLAGCHVLLPRADIGREETVTALRDRGAVVSAVTVYHTVPARSDPDAVRALELGVDAVVFTSPSTVRNFFQLLGGRARGLLDGTTIASIGPVTSAAVVEAGLTVQVEPAEHTTDGLLTVLESYFASHTQCGAGENA